MSDNRIVVTFGKIQLSKTEVTFLGHETIREVIRPSEDEVRVNLDHALPSSNVKLTFFLGLVSFYCRFILHSAERLLPLTDVLLSNPCKPLLTDAAQVTSSEINSAIEGDFLPRNIFWRGIAFIRAVLYETQSWLTRCTDMLPASLLLCELLPRNKSNMLSFPVNYTFSCTCLLELVLRAIYYNCLANVHFTKRRNFQIISTDLA